MKKTDPGEILFEELNELLADMEEEELLCVAMFARYLAAKERREGEFREGRLEQGGRLCELEKKEK